MQHDKIAQLSLPGATPLKRLASSYRTFSQQRNSYLGKYGMVRSYLSIFCILKASSNLSHNHTPSNLVQTQYQFQKCVVPRSILSSRPSQNANITCTSKALYRQPFSSPSPLATTSPSPPPTQPSLPSPRCSPAMRTSPPSTTSSITTTSQCPA